MRILTQLIFFLIFGVNAFSNFDPTSIFPSDINQYPLLFLNYSEPTHQDKLALNVDLNKAQFYFPRQESRNAKTEKYISENLGFKHLLISESMLDSFNTEIYKYVIRYKLAEVYADDSITGNGSDNRDYATKFNRKFTSVFYIENRQTGFQYSAYIDPKSYRETRGVIGETNNTLPMKMPKDRNFYIDLAEYIRRLNKYGSDLVVEADSRRYHQSAATEKSKNILVSTAAITTFVGTYIVFQILIHGY